MKYEINQQSEIPIYQQLADMIAADIKSGKLAPGTKLPTVRELSDDMELARGTVKRTYDELRKDGVIDMTQGRGTFVRYQPMNSKSRKERAMAAIDQMFSTLKGLDIPPSEIQIFVELKLRDYVQRGETVKVALVECSPEILNQLADRFRDMDGVEVFPFLLEAVVSYPYKIGDDMDLIITSAVHADELGDLLPNSKKILRAALAMRPQCIKNIAQLSPGTKAGVACKSERFSELITEVCKSYSGCRLDTPFYFGDGSLGAYLAEKDAVLVPANYESFCSAKEAEILQRFSARHVLVLCTYQTDQGSLLYFEERIKDLKERKKL